MFDYDVRKGVMGILAVLTDLRDSCGSVQLDEALEY